jgi:hypothetical protein
MRPTTATKDNVFDINALIHPGTVFNHPRDVVSHPRPRSVPFSPRGLQMRLLSLRAPPLERPMA